jgi:hypothetical protein
VISLVRFHLPLSALHNPLSRLHSRHCKGTMLFICNLISFITVFYISFSFLFFLYATPLYPQTLALTSPTSGGISVGIVRLQTKATELLVLVIIPFFPSSFELLFVFLYCFPSLISAFVCFFCFSLFSSASF